MCQEPKQLRLEKQLLECLDILELPQQDPMCKKSNSLGEFYFLAHPIHPFTWCQLALSWPVVFTKTLVLCSWFLPDVAQISE
jgi:hypothetical protein